ncbi:hypothetical protein KGF54_001202 [Candida jiufengensis]|uniref:uncharacterized protein n=1 Tax=Candida jiufengensis TaxID=497108 RepID=UPI00222585B2|nr:uncharacterized protein KGF54_001202 [Candida jiufengensis]KAI5955700.1 hypothetical protein KGF54_001202 [Candida jiufengensis]
MIKYLITNITTQQISNLINQLHIEDEIITVISNNRPDQLLLHLQNADLSKINYEYMINVNEILNYKITSRILIIENLNKFFNISSNILIGDNKLNQAIVEIFKKFRDLSIDGTESSTNVVSQDNDNDDENTTNDNHTTNINDNDDNERLNNQSTGSIDKELEVYIVDNKKLKFIEIMSDEVLTN